MINLKRYIIFLLVLCSAIGYAQSFSSIQQSCIGTVDSDGDGIADECDLDDDNDGILDITENCSGFIAQNTNGVWSGKTSSNLTVSLPSATFQTNIHNFSDDQIKYYVNQLGADQRYYKEGNINFSYTFSNPVPANEIAFFIDDLDFFAGSSSAIFTILINGNPPNGSFSKVDYGTTPYLTFDNISGEITPSGNPNDQRLIIKGISNILVSSFSITSTGVGTFDGIAYSLFANKPCDTDGDGIVNQLDLDSDNDGCPDVIEGGANFTSGASYITNNALNTTVNSSGVPAVPSATPTITGYDQTNGQTVNQAYTVNPAVAGTVGSNQTIVSGSAPSALSLTGSTGTIQWQSSTDNVTFANISGATSASYSPGTMTSTTYYRAVVSSLGGCSVNTNLVVITVVPNTDSDGDEVVDYYDLDDDNDGILDTDEGFCLSTPLLVASKTFSATGSGAAGRPNITFSAPTTGTGKRLMFLTLTLERDHTPTPYGDNWESTLPATNNFANAPVVKFGSNNMFASSYNTSFKYSPSNSHSNATISVTQYVYTLWDSQISAGSNSIDLSNFQLPKNAGDEWHAEVLVFDHVNNLEYIGEQASNLATNSLSISGNMLANSQPAGTIEQNNVLLAFGATSAQSGMSINSGWNAITTNSVANTNGTYATDPNTSSDLPENDGISVFTATKTGVTGNQTATFSFNKSISTAIMYRLIPFSCNLRDTDGDSIPDYLDLDSDGDGCPDAIEGGAAFTTSDLQNSSMPGGNTGTNYNGTAGSITSNLGNTVGNTPTTMGVPTIAGTGQGVGGSRIATNYSQCLDSDGDGYPDWQDLDDDNDGILDTAEICKSAISTDFFSGQSTTITTVNGANVVPTTATITPAITYYFIGWHYGVASGAINQEMSINFSNPVYFASDNVDFALGGLDIGSSFGNFFVVYEDGVRLSNLDFSLTNITGNITTSTINGAKAFNSGAGPNSTGSLTLNGIDRTKRIIKMGYTVHALNGSSGTSEDIRPRIQIDCDIDGDGIPNQLDLDSDGDGCPDVIEGGANFQAGASYITGDRLNTTVNSSGVAAVPTATPAITGYSQASGQTVNQSQTVNPAAVAGTASANQSIISGTAPTALTLTGSTGSIQWQVSSDNVTFTNVATSGTTASYSPGTLTATRYYRAVVTSAGGCTATSNVVTITVVPAYDCTGKIYSLSSVTGEIRIFNDPNNSGNLGTIINTATPPSAISGDGANGPNALGYSNATQKFYYVLNQNGGIGNTFVSYDPATNIYETLASTNGYIYRGTVTNDGLGYYAMTSTNTLKYYDITSNTWTNITTNYVDQNGVNINSILSTYSGGDLAMDGNGDLWILAGTTTSPTAYVFRVKSAVPKTSMGTTPLVLEQIVKQNIGISPNGISFSPAGELFITNATTLFRMNNDFTISAIGSISPSNGGGDLASCATPLNPFAVSDFGDAPDTYKTLLASNGPRHTVSQYDATNNTASLMIGSNIDLENDGFPNTNANGDDTNNINDESSVTWPILYSNVTAYTATIPVANTTGLAATLRGWIDFNKNGTFEAAESTSVTVANGATSVSLTWTGISGISAGNTYFRLRIARNASDITLPTGSVFGGEVEDGIFIISGPGGCYEDPNTNPADSFTKTGISDILGFNGGTTGWPGNVPNGFIAVESRSKGFVISRVNHVGGTNGTPNLTTDSITAPVEGMIVYDLQDNCVKLFDGSIWKCIEKDCSFPNN